MYKDALNLNLICCSPKVAFSSILKEKPRNIIFTSGTLPGKSIYEDLTGIKFTEKHSF
jgi:hypothetical protein